MIEFNQIIIDLYIILNSMIIKIVILSIVIGATLANHCANVPQHYYELGCTAIKDSNGGPCPTRFKNIFWK